MAWDPTTQWRAQLVGAQKEFGTATLGTDGTVEIATKLRTLLAATAMHKAPASGLLLVSSSIMCDGTVTSGAVTFADAAGAIHSGATIWYSIIGLA